EVNPRESRHARSQQPVFVLNRQLDPVSRLVVLSLVTLAADLGDDTAKGVIRKRAGSQPHSMPDTHIADLTFRHVNSQQQLARVSYAANLRTLLKVMPRK